ncbi:MAG: hypothetical protein E3J90_14405 [Promethearchaeota archaeon]|nr:MAG: hypothetical protein E3J90_14405 [Candidatus Lokiarchaeota archaeon]
MSDIKRDSDIQKLLLAKILIDNIKNKGIVNNLAEVEFKVFSQFGEDGIIQYLINNIPIKNKIFIEFGVQDYKESNTRFLLINNNWKGLLIDSDRKNINSIKNDEIYWKYDIKAVCKFVTRENINSVFSSNGFEGDIGLLSIDIDGNDYWIWKAIKVINPSIVICEYNSVFGCKDAVTIPYGPNFNRTKAHFSNLYFGASMHALYYLANKKGYIFIGSNSAGNNAFFIKKDFAKFFKKLTLKEGYVISNIRGSRNKEGRLTYISGEDRKKIIEDLEVYNVKTKEKMKIKDL